PPPRTTAGPADGTAARPVDGAVDVAHGAAPGGAPAAPPQDHRGGDVIVLVDRDDDVDDGRPGDGTGTERLFRRTRALAHDVRRPPVDPDRVAADWRLMFDLARRDDELAAACGFTGADLTGAAERARIRDLAAEIGPSGGEFP